MNSGVIITYSIALATEYTFSVATVAAKVIYGEYSTPNILAT